jgi:YD repeat-containing protein
VDGATLLRPARGRHRCPALRIRPARAYYANGEKVTLERINANGEKQVYWYAYDALGSTTALLDAAGQVAAEYQSDEFGRLLTGNSLLNHYLFTGQEYDPILHPAPAQRRPQRHRPPSPPRSLHPHR